MPGNPIRKVQAKVPFARHLLIWVRGIIHSFGRGNVYVALCAFPSVFLFSVSWKVPGETAFLHHLLEFVISGPVPEASLAGHAREPLPEGAGESAVYPAPSRFGTWQHLTPSEGVTFMWHYVRPPSVFLFSVSWKVPGETAFLHHLLEFVISGPVPEASLAGHAREPHPEGAGESAVCPSPSRFGTWSHFTPSERVAKSRHFPTPSEGVIGPFPDQYLL